MGGDDSVIEAARVSNGDLFEDASKGPVADQRLINFLVKHRHGSPFEHATFQFYIKAPLFVRSEWHRHRMASYNEISGRYVEYEPEFYIPAHFRLQGTTNKQGSEFPPEGWTFKANQFLTYTPETWDEQLGIWFEEQCDDAFAAYQGLLAMGLAKEMARMVLPVNLYTKFYMTVNARGLMNFLSLRAANDAQFEIREYAKVIETMFKDAMPMTYLAWSNNGRIAP